MGIIHWFLKKFTEFQDRKSLHMTVYSSNYNAIVLSSYACKSKNSTCRDILRFISLYAVSNIGVEFKVPSVDSILLLQSIFIKLSNHTGTQITKISGSGLGWLELYSRAIFVALDKQGTSDADASKALNCWKVIWSDSCSWLVMFSEPMHPAVVEFFSSVV